MGYKKSGKNSYKLTVSNGYNKNGKQNRFFKTIDLSHIPPKKQEAEAKRQFILYQEEIKKGCYVNNEKITFEEFINHWIENYANSNLQPKTLLEYGRLLKRITPALGHLKLIQLQPIHLTSFYNNLRENGIREDNKDGGLSEKTILHHHRLISSILTSALQWGFILNNPASRVKAPKVIKKEARHFNEEQTQYILKLIEAEPLKYRVMITLSIYGGMRQGELTALTWDDIEFNNSIIKINKSLQHLPGKGTFIKSTKTETSRVISIPKSVLTLLREYKLWQNIERTKLGDLWHDNNALFTTNDGSFIFPSTISKWFLKFIRTHNKKISNDSSILEKDKLALMLPEVNFHGLRHTSATLLINQNVDVSTVSKRLGHARTSTTMDIYSHSLQKSDMLAADKLEHLFTKSILNKKQI
ncbi:site-specific integrase [Clostridium sp. C8-1-8]|uniref:site-specific integrase n=1 Tax=Clostridium sp. C8-1-8 TaxID=2698831 RepID=UPI00136E895D|nr:site-specific integrase [Clostridium sp. C8-1-8]